MEHSLRLDYSSVGLFVDRLHSKDLKDVKDKKAVSAGFSIRDSTTICYNEVYYDKKSNTIYSIGSYFTLFVSTLYYQRYSHMLMKVNYSFESSDKTVHQYNTFFSNIKMQNNKIEFSRDYYERQSYNLINVLELDYYLSMEIIGRKRLLLEKDYKKPEHVDPDEFDYSDESIKSFKEMISGFDDTKDFVYDNSPRYFIKYYIKKNNLHTIEALTDKELSEAYSFLKKITNFVVESLPNSQFNDGSTFSLHGKNPFDYSMGVRKSVYATLYNAFYIGLSLDGVFGEKEFFEELKKDENSLSFKVYDDCKNPLLLDDLMYFRFPTYFVFPYDELFRKNIQLIEIFYKEKSFGRFSFVEYLEKATKKIQLKID